MVGDGRLVWMDLEMTGLDVSKERIIEVATLVTDKDLQIVAEGPDLVIRQPASVLDAMDEWNRRHHRDSGLTKAVREATLTEAEAEAQTISFISVHCEKGRAPLAGNSVHTDRLFLMKYMPELESWINYRNVDVSTLKELAKRWSPEVYAQRPTKKGSHRALEDIFESLDELRYYRQALFR